MTVSSDAVQILRTPEVKSYMVNMFEVSRSGEQSYERLLDFFKSLADLEQYIALRSENALDNRQGREALVSEAAKYLGIWDPERILNQTQSCIGRGLQRFRYAQHQDGGWGYYTEYTSAWATAHALLALEAARQLGIVSDSTEVERGFSWLTANPDKWSLTHIPPDGWGSIYEASLVIRCFIKNGRTFNAVDSSLKEILRRQNPDGSWDAAYPGAECFEKTKLESDLGATSMALQALAAVGNGEFESVMEGGLRWIFSKQHPGGSWPSGPNETSFDKRNQPSLSKTCDALSGIAAARNAGVKLDSSRVVSNALDWVFQQEKFLSHASGWGYNQVYEVDKNSDLVSTCLVLEALVQTHNVELPLIAPYAHLLVAAQFDRVGSPEDGMWKLGDTFRITLALIQYWVKINARQATVAPPEEAAKQAAANA